MPSPARHHIAVTVAVLVVLALRDAPVKSAGQYTVINLGTVPGTTNSFAAGINASGTVLARATIVGSSTETTFTWRNGVRTELAPGDGYPKGIAINDLNQVVGSIGTFVNGRYWDRAFLWTAGLYTDLGALGLESSYATGINNAGQVVGIAIGFTCEGNGCSSSLYKAFVWSGGTQTDLGSLGGVRAGAWAINDAGQILGSSNLVPGQDGHPIHAVLWANGTMTDLASIGMLGTRPNALNDAGEIAATIIDPIAGAQRVVVYANGSVTGLMVPPGLLGASATAINAAGDVIGQGRNIAGRSHAFLYHGGAVGLLAPTARSSSPYAINANGQVVGAMVRQGDPDSNQRAFLYDAGSLYDLNDFLPPGSEWERLSAATDINDAGQIVGWGLVGGIARAFRMDPLP